MDNQAYANTSGNTNKWSAIKAEITNIWGCIKNWYNGYKNADHKILRRRCSSELMICTKNAPDTPLHKVSVSTDISFSLVEVGLLALGFSLLCILFKLLRRCCW
ncbi:MAG TPA: hypothetical protein GXX22_00675 [Clostridiales bacterium]|nr:hypothetical protein [Clostridiales bacterium]